MLYHKFGQNRRALRTGIATSFQEVANGHGPCQLGQRQGVKYFIISYTDLFGGQRAKWVP